MLKDTSVVVTEKNSSIAKEKNHSDTEEKKKKEKKKISSRTERSKLILSVSRIEAVLRRGMYARRIGEATPIYLAGIAQAAIEMILDAAVKYTKDEKRCRIVSSNIREAIISDPDLRILTDNAVIFDGGRKPQIKKIVHDDDSESSSLSDSSSSDSSESEAPQLNKRKQTESNKSQPPKKKQKVSDKKRT